MAKKKHGGAGRGQGRKPNPVKKKRMTVSVPKKDYKEIREKTVKLAKAYEEKCKKEL